MKRPDATAMLTFAFVAVLIAAMVMSSCSPKKNNAATRQYQAFITKYNIYYNGDTHYKETLDEMEKNYEDDYTQLLYLHPAEARANEKAPQPSGDFTRSIEKAQKAIQLRSIKKRPRRRPGKSNDAAYKEWLKRDEYNPFLHNAWLMMGRSQFMNGDFLGAASTFFYISKHFRWLPQTVTEAKLWQARCYCSLDWLFEAETILTRIKTDELTDKELKLLYATTYADFLIKSHKPEEAIPYLRQGVDLSSGQQKTRLRFLLGQLYERTGQKKAAYEEFKKVGSSSGASYRTQFNARIKQSEVFEGNDIRPEVEALQRMTRYDRNKDFLDQIYYAIGNLYLSRNDTLKAIENYRLAAEKSTRSGIEKAIAQITLGTLYFDRHQYDLAQPCYAEALPLLPDNYPGYETMKKRSDVLDELAVYAQNVSLQDSLLRLSAMSHEQQLAVVNKIIDELKKKEKEEAEKAAREEYLAQQAASGTGLNDNSASAPNTFTLNTDKSWYFYNTATRNAGKTAFQKRWGSRRLEDDWRRRNKSSFSFNDFDENQDDSESPENTGDTGDETVSETQGEEKANADDPHYPEYYLKQIPKTDAERTTSNDIIQEGLYNMGIILKDKLEDFPAATSEFDRLLTRYPDNVYRLDVYYNLYLMFMREGKTALADRYRLLIVNEFPDSKYGIAMRDPAYLDNLRRMEREEETIYADAYEAYLDNRNADVHRAYADISERYPMSKIMPKFMFIDALAYVTENKPDEFKERLKTLLERYPETDITPVASSYLSGLARGRKLHSGGSNVRSMLWETRLAGDSAQVSDDEISFALDPEDKQLFILLYPTDSVSANELLYTIARHNFTSFVVKDFDLEQMNFGRLGLLIVKGFDNLAELNNYRRVMAESSTLQLPPQVRPVIISASDFDKLLKEGRSFDDYFRYAEEQMYVATEENVLPPEIFGPSEGIPDETVTEATDTVTNGPQHTPESDETRQPEEKNIVQPSPAPADTVSQPKSPEKTAPRPKPAETKPKQARPDIKNRKDSIKTDTRPKPLPKKKLPDYLVGSEGDSLLLE